MIITITSSVSILAMNIVIVSIDVEFSVLY